jgi:DNA invertase Pin-like site-specific DNA recombinase
MTQYDVGRIHAYTRVSSLEQAQEGYSLGEQERQLREIAARHHPDRDFLLWSDPAVSGSVPLAERPEGGNMVKALRGGDLVIATKLDRVFRDMRDALNQVEEFRARQIHCILLDICPDLKSITGQTVPGNLISRFSQQLPNLSAAGCASDWPIAAKPGAVKANRWAATRRSAGRSRTDF